MSWISLFLGLILTLAGAAGLAASFDLLTTELGVLYATCGAIAVSGGFIVIAIALLTRRVDALRGTILQEGEMRSMPRFEPPAPAAVGFAQIDESGGANAAARSEAATELAPSSAPDESSQQEEEAPINENRRGHLPGLEPLEHAAREPASLPTLVGRYSAGGANYSIFSDGSIQAETDQGEFKFGSMSEFKAFIAAKRS
jgi:hypothetical protein